MRAGERIELDAAALWDGDGLHGDLPLQPRDQVVVPAAEVFVTVLGEVNRPGVIPFQHGLTVSDYLLRAGGPHPRGRPVSNRITSALYRNRLTEELP